MTFKELLEEVEGRARDNARTMVASGPDETIAGCRAVRDSALSIIESMSSEREHRHYDLPRPITRAQVLKLQRYFDKRYDDIVKASKKVMTAAHAGVDTGGEGKWITSCELHGNFAVSRTKKLAELADPLEFCDGCREA